MSVIPVLEVEAGRIAAQDHPYLEGQFEASVCYINCVATKVSSLLSWRFAGPCDLRLPGDSALALA